MIGLEPDDEIRPALNRVFDAYGVGSTNLILISGVFISTLGFSQRIDAAVWIVSVFAGFSFMYMFRAHVPHNLLRAATASILLSMLFVVPALVVVLTQGLVELESYFRFDVKLSTAYVALGISLPAALLLLSYRQHDQSRAPLSRKLALLVKRNVTENDFIYRKVVYKIRFEIRDNSVYLQFRITVHAASRAKSVAKYTGIFDPAGADPRFHFAKLNGMELDTSDPDRRTIRGYMLSYDCPPEGEFMIDVAAESRFNTRDSEYISAFRPTEDCRIEIERLPPSLVVDVQSMLIDKPEPRRLEGGGVAYEMTGGFLPHQGLRLLWNIRTPGV